MKTPLTNIDLESHMHVIVLPNQQIDYDTSVVAESFFSYVTINSKTSNRSKQIIINPLATHSYIT
jgi:hypothetical protein